MLDRLVGDFKSPVTPERWAEFATGLRDFALGADSAQSSEEIIAACEMLEGLRSGWRAANRQFDSLEAYPIFNGSDALQRILECHRKYQAAETRPRMRDLPRGRAIDLIWFCEGSIDDKLATWHSLLNAADIVGDASFAATYNGMKNLVQAWKGLPPTSSQIEVFASIVSISIEKCPAALEPKRPLSFLSFHVMSLHWLSKSLAAAGNPRLSQVASHRIYAFSVAVEEDSAGWNAKGAREAIKAAADLNAAYGPK